MMTDIAIFVFPSLAFRRAARRALAADFAAADVDAILLRAAEHRATMAAGRKGYAVGVSFIMRYFEWAFGLYRALQEKGWSPERAGACIEAIQWSIFEPTTALQYRISRLRSSVPIRRAKFILDLLFATVFARPYERKILPSKEGVEFDVVVCPLASVYRDLGAGELTRYAACSLDHRMARVWGVSFTRTKTLAEGHSHCDFRFR